MASALTLPSGGGNTATPSGAARGAATSASAARSHGRTVPEVCAHRCPESRQGGHHPGLCAGRREQRASTGSGTAGRAAARGRRAGVSSPRSRRDGDLAAQRVAGPFHQEGERDGFPWPVTRGPPGPSRPAGPRGRVQAGARHGVSVYVRGPAGVRGQSRHNPWARAHPHGQAPSPSGHLWV